MRALELKGRKAEEARKKRALEGKAKELGCSVEDVPRVLREIKEQVAEEAANKRKEEARAWLAETHRVWKIAGLGVGFGFLVMLIGGALETNGIVIFGLLFALGFVAYGYIGTPEP